MGRAERRFGLGNKHLETVSPLGSPTAFSPRLVLTLADLARPRRDLVAARGVLMALQLVLLSWPVLNRFCNMRGLDGLRLREIGNRARQLQDAVKRAR